MKKKQAQPDLEKAALAINVFRQLDFSSMSSPVLRDEVDRLDGIMKKARFASLNDEQREYLVTKIRRVGTDTTSVRKILEDVYKAGCLK